MGQRENDLLRQIDDAFATGSFPGDDNIATESYGDEPSILRREFRGKTDWRTLTASFLDRAGDGSGLAFFTDAALHFYLPAYLSADVRGELSLACPHAALACSFTEASEHERIAQVWGGGSMADHARRRFERFNLAQVRVVIAYLTWKLDDADGDDPVVAEALERYWRPRESLLAGQ